MPTFQTIFKKIIFPFFPFVIFIGGTSGIHKSFSKFYYLVISPHSFKDGCITSVDRVSASNGKFFDCNIIYKVEDKPYQLTGTISSADRKAVNVNDSVVVWYNDKIPQISSIESRNSIFIDVVFIYL